MRRVTLVPVLVATGVLTGAGFAVTVAVPAATDALTTRTAATRAYTKGEAAGRRVFVGQGCVGCHTMQVRDTFVDAGLGSRPTQPGDTLGERPGLFGGARFGPDLTCVGDRVLPDAPEPERIAALMSYLVQPSQHSGSTMPSYAYLSRTALRRLATYLVSLRCDTAPGIAPTRYAQ